MKYTSFGRVVENKLVLRDRKSFDDFLKTLNEKDIQLTIEKKRNKRSVWQNNLWWLYMGILANELGYTKDEIHEVCKFKFCQEEKVIESTGEIVPYLRSTTSYTKGEFIELIGGLQRWAIQELNILLPDPEDYII